MPDAISLLLNGHAFQLDVLRARCLQGDPDALEAIRYQLAADITKPEDSSVALFALAQIWERPITRWLARDFFDGSPEDAQEAWNATLCRVVERLTKFDPRKSKFSTWIYNQARYAAIDRRREILRLQRGDSLSDAVGSVEAEDPSPLSALELSALQRAFKRLTENERQLLFLRHCEQLDYDEICLRKSLEIKREHVRIYVRRAGQRFEKFYSDELERH